MAGSIGRETAEKVVAIREKWHTKNHPFFLEFAAGKFGLGPVAAMMVQHYQHVRRVLPVQGIAYYRAAEGEARRFILENLAEEEGLMAGPGEGRVAHDHMDMIFRFCRAAGLSDDEVKRTRQLSTWRARSYFYITTVRDEPFGVVVAMQSTQEGQQPALNGERMLPAFKKYHGFEIDHPTIEFFAEHYVADADHSSRQIDLVAKLVNDEATAARALDVAETAVRTRWDCITEIYRREVLGQMDPLPAGINA
ncbi:MAG TPA: iron-containing redox enzyme family protein [Stellaceae bacterium]|nr:iron-containing redox enzyme family protein [Stellaceae bacterium]